MPEKSLIQQWRALRRERIRLLIELQKVQRRWEQLKCQLTPRQKQQICLELQQNNEIPEDWGLESVASFDHPYDVSSITRCS